jgi:hypothetical protein
MIHTDVISIFFEMDTMASFNPIQYVTILFDCPDNFLGI